MFELRLTTTIIHQNNIMSTTILRFRKCYVNFLCKLHNMYVIPYYVNSMHSENFKK